MKQGWEIKKLGEVVKKLFAGGDKPKLFAEYQTEQLSIPVYANGISLDGLVGYTDKAIVEEESITISARGTIGFCCVRKSPFVPIVRLITLIPSEDIKTEYLCYVLRNTKFDNNGVAIPQLTIPMIREMLIPIPPREEQERIVEELDCLSGVIEKKREQLRELDALAQSIFYQMFGDPITNEKGWGVIPLKQAALLKAGKAIKANELSEDSDLGLYPCYGGNGIRGYINKKSHNGQFPIIGRQGALCGNVVFAQGEFYATEHAVVCNNIIESFNPLWLYYALKYNNLNRYAQGVAQPGISVNIINEMPLIYPPLILQQEFAEKIESIEKQKELIKQSITQTEELFNARMDYYFN